MRDIRRQQKTTDINWLTLSNKKQLAWAGNYLRKKNYIPTTKLLAHWHSQSDKRYVTEFINAIKKNERIFEDIDNEKLLKKMFNAWEKQCERNNKKSSSCYISEMVSIGHKSNFDKFRYSKGYTVKKALEFLIELGLEHQKVQSMNMEYETSLAKLGSELADKANSIEELQERIKELEQRQQQESDEIKQQSNATTFSDDNASVDNKKSATKPQSDLSTHHNNTSSKTPISRRRGKSVPTEVRKRPYNK